MTAINLIFPIEPKPKGRPRFNGRRRPRTPDSTRSYERTLQWIAVGQYKGPAFDEPVSVSLNLIFKKPKRHKYDYPTRGDIDNYCKAIFDAMNKILWTDDRLIVKLKSLKMWGEKGEILLSVRPISDF